MAPADENECRQMLYTATHARRARPRCAIRAARVPGVPIAAEMTALPGRHARELRREGRSGPADAGVRRAWSPRRSRSPSALDATLVNMRFVKPLDEELVLATRRAPHARVVTLEENAIAGGAGSAVGELLAADGHADSAAARIGIPDRFIEHGSREDCLAAGRTRRRLARAPASSAGGHCTARTSALSRAKPTSTGRRIAAPQPIL